MGLLANIGNYVAGEAASVKYDLIKAGVLTPDKNAFEQKSSLIDPFGYQSLTAYGYKEKYSILDYYKLRQITFADPIISAIIQTRTNQVAAFGLRQPNKYKTGFKVALRDEEKEPTKAEKARCREFEQLMLNCGVPESFEDTPELKRRDNFDTFLRKICRDTLTYDQVNFEITPRRNGTPYSFTAVDAATIRLVPDKKETQEVYQSAGHDAYDFLRVMAPAPREVIGKEFQPKHPKYVQVINGIVRHVFDEWEMCFGIRNPRTDILSYGYGFGELEMLVTIVTAHMNAESYNRKFFSQGSVAKGMLAFEGGVPRDQLEAFRRQWHQQITGINNAWKTPIMAVEKDTKVNWISFQQTNREMEFGKWMEYCIKTICGVYQIDPIEIGFDISKMGAGQNSSSGGMGEGNPVDRIVQSQDKGLRPLLKFLQGLLNEYIIYRLDPNFEFQFVGLNAKSEKDDLDQTVQEVKSYKTINEVRKAHDMEELKSLDDIESIGDLILDPSIINTWSQERMADKQQEMGMDGMGGDGQSGQDGSGNNQNEEDDAPVNEGDAQPPVDYEGMSDAKLQSELTKLNGGNGKNGATAKSMVSRTLKL